MDNCKHLWTFMTISSSCYFCYLECLTICSSPPILFVRAPEQSCFAGFRRKTLRRGKSTSVLRRVLNDPWTHFHCKRFAGVSRLFCSSASQCTPVGRSPTARPVRSSTGVGQGEKFGQMSYLSRFVATITALYQMLAPSRIVTLPITIAPGAMKTSSAIVGQTPL